MRILYIHQYFATPDCNAGTRSYEFARRMIADGHEVVFLTTSAYLRRQPEPPELQRGWTELDIEGIRVHVLLSSYRNELGFLARVLSFFAYAWRSSWKGLRIGRFDLIYATSTPLTVGIPALFISTIRRVPYVFEVRDLWPDLPIAVGALKHPVPIWIARRLERIFYKHAKAIVALSPSMKEGIVGTGVAESKVSVVPNSSDIDLFSVAPADAEAFAGSRLGFLSGRRLVVYAGTLGVVNDLTYLVDLCVEVQKLTDNICFLVVGEGIEREKVVRHARVTGVLDRSMHFWPGMSKTDLAKLLANADFSVSTVADRPEMQANSANKFFDALASGTPIVINHGGWQKDIIESYNCGLVLDRRDMASSAKRLVSNLEDSSLLALQSQSAKSLAMDEFCRDRVYRKLASVLLDAAR